MARKKNPPSAGPVDPIEPSLRDILKKIGEDPAREGLERTPYRYAHALRYLTQGYAQDPKEVIGKGIFKDDSASELVLVRDIELFSLCEHHLLPFYGKAHVAYIPNGKIVGLSKIPRIIDLFSRRLQVQERLTTQVADTMVSLLKPKGVAVVIEASHFCMMMRGVEKQHSRTITSAMRGAFRNDPKTRMELFSLISGSARI